MVREPDLRSTGRGFQSQPPQCRVQPWTSSLHTCASVTKQYNLVPANERRCSSAGQVTAGLTESNGSLPLGLWLQSRTGISSGTLRSFPVWNYLYLGSLWHREIMYARQKYRAQIARDRPILIAPTHQEGMARLSLHDNWFFCWFTTVYAKLFTTVRYTISQVYYQAALVIEQFNHVIE